MKSLSFTLISNSQFSILNSPSSILCTRLHDRKARGLRQEDMAKLLGVSRQTIVAMENDKYDPTLELAIKTARLLEQPVEKIFFLDEES